MPTASSALKIPPPHPDTTPAESGDTARAWGLLSFVVQDVRLQDRFWRVLLDAVQAGPIDGGCLICARALQGVFGGQLVHIADADSGLVLHYGVQVGSVVVDFDGPCQTSCAWLARFRHLERADRPLAFHSGLGAPGEIPECPAAEQRLLRLLRDSMSKHPMP